MKITFDIETVPCQWPDIAAELAQTIHAPGTLKKAESISAWEAESKPALVLEAVAKTSFDGGLGQVVCIGWAIEEQPAQSLQAADLSAAAEADMLREWFAILISCHRGNSGMRPCLIGHNSNAFDLPFLWKRAMVLGIKPPMWFPRDPKPWGDTTFDTMTAWAGVRDRISMDRLCRVLGIPGKGDGPSGADVWPMVQAGRVDDVAAYCRADVDRTRAIYRRMTFVDEPPIRPAARLTVVPKAPAAAESFEF